jgi:Tol biopolymer transport system component
MRRVLPIAGTLLAILIAGPANAQYFGRNQVQYRHLDFSVIETDHFDVYFYEEEREAALDAARMAERTYARFSRLLNHKYRERQPIILFASHSEFQQNNVSPVGEGTGGFTEWFRHRVLLPFTGSYADFEHVLQHELAHQFQIDIFARGRIGAGIQRLLAVNPPLWFMEGMAEYLSSGPITPQTAVWLRDAALDRGLPSLEELTWDPSYTPYRFGHALWSYIGERWGDEAVGEILNAAGVSGIPGAFRRALGVKLDDLVADWHDAIQRTYLPQLADLQQARQLARPVLSKKRSTGTLHISPAISPDGSEIAYLSEGNTFFIDLYLADAETGRVKRRLIKSAFSTDFESLRFINSVGAWSPDSRFFAFAAKRGGADDLVIFDVRKNRVHGRITVPLAGVTTPSWSPDGSHLVFSGYEGGLSDLFIVAVDGTNLRRLTHDRYADLHPAWSPDGKSIAFVTDRGPHTDMDQLQFGGLSIARFHLDDQSIDLLMGMSGNNINPQWAPDGRSIAFVSDRTGIPNVFLYDLGDRLTYQLTSLFTGATGITPLSPAISWASLADRLVFTYYEAGEFDVYGLDNPRSLKGEPYDDLAPRPVVASLLTDPTPRRDPSRTRTGRASRLAAMIPLLAADSSNAARRAEPTAGASYYRAGAGLRASGQVPEGADSTPPPISVKALLDSATLALPDSLEFTFRNYSAKLTPDYIVQPSIGYVRDNFGSGIYGGSAIALSDMLGNHRLLAAGQINGRIDEMQILAVYANMSHRVNWAVGASQTPLFYFTSSAFGVDSLGRPVLTTTLDRYIVRELFFRAHHPFNRFRRVELGLRGVNVERDAVDFIEAFDPATGFIFDQDRRTRSLGSASYVQPSIAFVFDNSISLWVGPLMGRRNRFEYAPAIGDWRFHQFLADYRRYDNVLGPFTFATRFLFFGRFGRDSNQFPVFIGNPELLRGYTSGSLRNNECLTDTEGSFSGCSALDQLIGTRIGVFNAELRFPLTRNVLLGFAPIGIPPIEAALFFDAAVAWDGNSSVQLSREPTDNKALIRVPLTSWGLSLRANLLGFMILRFDFAKPLNRQEQGSYWTVSLGPTF